jgi:hypothetical protein
MRHSTKYAALLSTCISLAAGCTPQPTSGETGADGGTDVLAVDVSDASDTTAPTDATNVDTSDMDTIAADVVSSDTIADDANADDAPVPADGSASCAGPSHVFSGTITDITTHMPIAGASVQFVPCDATRVTSDATGAFSTTVPVELAGYARIDATGYLTALGQELVSNGDQTGTPVEAIPSALAPLGLPNFDATTATISIDAIEVASGASGSCASVDGVTFTVMGHPEAQVAYYVGMQPTPVPTATTSAGKAVISHLVPTSAVEFVTIVGSKAGCNLTFAYTRGPAAYTGRTPIAVGMLSIHHPQIGN